MILILWAQEILVIKYNIALQNIIHLVVVVGPWTDGEALTFVILIGTAADNQYTPEDRAMECIQAVQAQAELLVVTADAGEVSAAAA
jgi:hypothetical protein